MATVLTLALLLGTAFSVVSPEVAGSPSSQASAPRGVEVVATALLGASEAPLAGVSVLGDYAFVGGMSTGYTTTANVGIRIVDLSTPEQPQLVSRIPLRSRSGVADHSHGDAIAAHITSPAFVGDIAVVLNGVPETFSPEDYPQPYGIWDVTDPSNPQFLSILDVGYTMGGYEGGDLGDKPYDSKAITGNHFYTIYDTTPSCLTINSRSECEGPLPDPGVAVVDVSDPGNPIVVGDWQDDPQVYLMGLTVNEMGTRAYVTGISPWPTGLSARDGYIYILDIQNPSQLTEIGRYIFPLRGVPSSVSKAVPNNDDSLLIVADHSWESTKCGILTILDISDMAVIHEISTFALPESSYSSCRTIATDVAVDGSLIYSTWGNGGMRIVDFSDPRRPVQVGEYRGRGSTNPDWWLSDVAVKDDLVVATRVWGSGFYVFRLTDEVPTVVIDETSSLRVSTNAMALPAFHVSWEWPDGTREAAWDGFLNIGGADYEIGNDGWVYVGVRQFGQPLPVNKVDLEVTGVYTWGVTVYVVEADPANVIFDRVQVFLEVRNPEIAVGETAEILIRADYAYDNSPFEGTVTLSENLAQGEAGTYSYTVISVEDAAYGLTEFSSNTVEVTFYALPPFYTQQSFLMLLFALVAAVGVAVFLWRRKPWRPKGAKARVDDIHW